MRSTILTYLAVAVPFAAVALLWLGTVADTPRWDAALLFYLLYPAAIMILAIPKADGDWQRALWLGAVLGLCAYGTYDLTNLATLRAWTVRLAMMDIAWGAALTALAAWLGSVASRSLTG
ncbi:MAG: DUF2177 family protein [Alphaproteobacteria bacterium]|nr:DUF2177 family protein [Alphaproteobacteria bacterium]